MPSPHRRAFIDWARGVAVLLMIEAHTVDAWTRAADRGSAAFGLARVAGGLAAPLFLWLAGVAVVLAASAAERRSGDRRAAADAVVRRGLEIFVLAFLFRLQAFVVSPGSSPVMLFRVDILNVMGPAIALAALLWGALGGPWARAWTFGGGASLVALATPLVRESRAVDSLPAIAQWYLRPSGEYTNFTLLPWAGFVLAGACVGVVVDRANRQAWECRAQLCLAAAGAAVMAAGFFAAGRPSVYARAEFWTSSPTYFAIRCGGMTMALAAMYFIERALGVRARALGWLQRFGQHSLFVYWIHVELVYGYASWLWRGRLPLAATIAGFAAFSLLMYGTLALRDRVVEGWRAGPPAGLVHAPRAKTRYRV